MEAWENESMEAWKHGNIDTWKHGIRESQGITCCTWKHGSMKAWNQIIITQYLVIVLSNNL